MLTELQIYEGVEQPSLDELVGQVLNYDMDEKRDAIKRKPPLPCPMAWGTADDAALVERMIHTVAQRVRGARCFVVGDGALDISLVPVLGVTSDKCGHPLGFKRPLGSYLSDQKRATGTFS